MDFCPTCGAKRPSGQRFCGNCGRDFGSAGSAEPQAPQSPQLTDRQALARSAMTVQTVQLLAYLGAGIGAAIGFVLPAWLLYDSLGQSNGLVWFLLCIGGGLLGLFVGSRVALSLMAR